MVATYGMQVLVVDDEPNIRFLVKESLRELQVTVFEAEDGVQALVVLHRENIDLMITDLRMPNMDGRQLLKEANQRFPHLVTLVLTAYGDRESVLDAMRLKVFDFLEKPFVSDVVLNRVKNGLMVELQRRLIFSAAKEFVVEHCHMATREQFELMNPEEKQRVLKAALGLISLRSNK